MRHYSGKDKKSLLQSIPTHYKFEKKDEIIESNSILFKEKTHFLIISYDEEGRKEYIPHLKSSEVTTLKKIVIDKGAVPFLLKGADMMRPGVVGIDSNIEVGESIAITDEVKGLIIGVGKALLNSEMMQSSQSGKVVKTLHYFKDSLYDVVL